MNIWYHKVAADISLIPDCVAFYEIELEEARKDLSLKGSIEQHSAKLPGILEKRFNQLQDLEGILEHVNAKLRLEKSIAYKKYNENYKKALSSRDIGYYVDGEPNVAAYWEMVNLIALVRNKYLGVMKGLDAKSYQINNITKLRSAGLEDATL